MPEANENYLSKVSLKTLGINGTKVVKDFTAEKKVIPLAQIYGIATSTKDKKFVDDNGEAVVSTPLIGDFEGVNLHTGEVWKSKVCYLPSSLHDQLVDELTPKEKGGRPTPVKFGVEIAAMQMENKSGFEYVAKFLFNATPETDPLADLRKTVTGSKNASKPMTQDKKTK